MRSSQAFLGLAVAVAVNASTAWASPYLSLDFEGQTTGTRPTAGTIKFPTANVGDGSNTGDVGVVVVGSSAINTGKALRTYDKSGTDLVVYGAALSGGGTQTGIFSFNFTEGPNPVDNTGNSFLRIALGSSGVDASSSSSSSNFQRLRIDTTPSGANGSLAASSNTSGSLSDTSVGTFVSADSNLVDLVFNRSTEAINYTKGGAQTVGAGKYDVYLNGTLVADDYALRTGTTNVEAFSIGSGGSQAAADWIFDNIQVTAVPEPASVGLLGVGALALLRRRRA